jgi:AAA domain
MPFGTSDNDSAEVSRDSVFVAGGQPSITYVERESLDVGRQLARAIATPNQIVSLSGPTKCGKTVLCKHVLKQKQYVWIKICYELNYPIEIDKASKTTRSFGMSITRFIFSASGSQLSEKETSRTYRIDAMSSALRHLLENDIVLVIDDFHYLKEDARREFVRNIKGSIFSGLDVVLLSVTHRTYDAIRAEQELTGRFISVTVPEWSKDDLLRLHIRGLMR